MKNVMKKIYLMVALSFVSTCVMAQTSTNDTQKKIDWKTVPVYTSQLINEVDENGKPLLNDDGTQKQRVYLVDQFGNYRSKKSVKAQQAAIRKAIAKVVGKTGLGGLLGAGVGVLDAVVNKKNTTETITQGAVGGVAGGMVGYSASEEDRALAKKHKQSLKEQEKLLEQYSKTFTDEGKPVDAKMDLSNVKGIDFTKGEPVAMKESELKKIIESEAFNSTDTSAWDI